MIRACFFFAAALAVSCARAKEGAVRQVGRLDYKDIKESSGLVVSRQYPGVLWTHNDGGGRKRQILYAVERAGTFIASFPITGVKLSDWEDIAIDDQGNLFVGDIGNNDAKRDRLFVHRVREPDPRGAATLAQVQCSWELRFPQRPFDCESLFIHGGFGYVISKVFDDQSAVLYRFALETNASPILLARVATLPVTSPVTGADLSADGRLLGLVCKSWAYAIEVNGDMFTAGRALFQRAPAPNKDLEGCAFAPDGLLATAESREIYLFEGPAFTGR